MEKKDIAATFGEDAAKRLEMLGKLMGGGQPQTTQVDMRPIFVVAVTAAMVWGKDPRGVNTSDVYGKVMDLMNMFFKDQ